MIDFNTIKPDQIALILKTGSLQSLPVEYQEYYDLMDFVRGLAAKSTRNGKLITKAAIIKLLKNEKQLSDYQARILYEDSINFFYESQTVKVEAWANYYAEQLEDAAKLALHSRDTLPLYKDLIKEAFRMRSYGKDKIVEFPKEYYRKQFTIYTTDVEDIGGIPEDLKELEKQLDALPEVPTMKLERAKMEAGINKFDIIRFMAEDAETFTDEEDKKG